MSEAKHRIEDQLAAYRAKKAREYELNEWKSKIWDRIYKMVSRNGKSSSIDESKNENKNEENLLTEEEETSGVMFIV